MSTPTNPSPFNPGYHAALLQTLSLLSISPSTPTPRFPRGDITSRRNGAGFARYVFALDPEISGIEKTIYKATAEDGWEVEIWGYRLASQSNGVGSDGNNGEQRERGERNGENEAEDEGLAVLYLHGGGMIFGSPELFEPLVKKDVKETGIPHFSVAYRLAPEHPHPTPLTDCYTALLYLRTHASTLSISPSRITVVGLSAGGGLAAGLCLLARDRKLSPPIQKMVLEYPMLDNLNTEMDKNREEGEGDGKGPLKREWVSWDWDDNWTGWNALLGNRMGDTEDIDNEDEENCKVGNKEVDMGKLRYAAPARARDLRGLPECYIDVGTLDIFRDECEVFAERMREAGNKLEWKLYKGVPHGFEFRGRGSKIVREAWGNRWRAIRGK